MADHPPAKARALIQDAKAGRRPITELLGEARGIADPSFVAEALAALADDPRLDVEQGGRALTDAATALNRAERAFRKAEAGLEVARRAAKWRTGEVEAEPFRVKAYASLANTAQGLQGKDLTALAVGLAKVAATHRAQMLRLVLHHGADPIEDAKAVLAAGPGPGVTEAIVDAPVAAQARLLAYHRAHGGEVPLTAALETALALPGIERREALRAIIAAAPAEDLATIHAKLPTDAEERGRLLCALAAQADRQGDATGAAAWFDEASQQVATLPEGKARDAIQRNINSGRARLSKAPSSPSTKQTPAVAAVTAPVSSGRHILGLVDAYEGQLGDVHFRALARAAPLCWAFGLDLGIVGFPSMDLQGIVTKAGKATGIGEGGGYLEKLAADGRVHVLPRAPTDKLGFLVATTPKPDLSRRTDFAAAIKKAKAAGQPRLLVLVGLGPNGLPGEWMRAALVHLELTGDNVSLETATAMGIIAERMRQLPLAI